MGMFHSEELVKMWDNPKTRAEADRLMRVSTDIDCSGDEDRTKQEFKDDADVNIIVARCLRSGDMSALAPQIAPVFADATAYVDYREQMNRIANVEEAFMKLPAKVRERFDHDPAKVLDFLKEPANLDEAVKLGIAVRRAEPAPVVEPGSPAPVPPK